MKYAAFVVAASLTACVETELPLEGELDDTTGDTQEVAENTCVTATPDRVMRISGMPRLGETVPDPRSITPETYDNPRCDRSWVIRVHNLLAERPSFKINLKVDYAGPRRAAPLTNIVATATAPNRATCQSIVMRAIRWEGSGLRRKLDDVSSAATWIVTGEPTFPGREPPGTCFVPTSITLPPRGPTAVPDVVAVSLIRVAGGVTTTLGVVVTPSVAQ